MIRTSVTAQLLLLLAALQSTVGAEMIATLTPAIVYLEQRDIETVEVTGQRYEVYLKPVTGGPAVPHFKTQVGTGFLIVEGDLLFLITAHHVAAVLSPQTNATIHTPGDKPLTMSLSQLVGGAALPWTVHSTADVAVLRLHPDAAVASSLAGHFLERSLLSSSQEAPPREEPLLTMGFPLGLGVKEHFSPISRESKPASGLVSIPRFDTKRPATFFLLDSPSIGGFSGAPVFSVPGAYSKGGGLVIGGTLSCVGLVHGTISDDTGGKLGAVVPSRFILETIDLAKSSR